MDHLFPAFAQSHLFKKRHLSLMHPEKMQIPCKSHLLAAVAGSRSPMNISTLLCQSFCVPILHLGNFIARGRWSRLMPRRCPLKSGCTAGGAPTGAALFDPHKNGCSHTCLWHLKIFMYMKPKDLASFSSHAFESWLQLLKKYNLKYEVGSRAQLGTKSLSNLSLSRSKWWKRCCSTCGTTLWPGWGEGLSIPPARGGPLSPLPGTSVSPKCRQPNTSYSQRQTSVSRSLGTYLLLWGMGWIRGTYCQFYLTREEIFITS